MLREAGARPGSRVAGAGLGSGVGALAGALRTRDRKRERFAGSNELPNVVGTLALFAGGSSHAVGTGSVKFELPVVPGLGGRDVFRQAFVLDAGAPALVSPVAGLMIGYS